MIIIPAIDIINGKCVRLQKGDYATAHQVAESVETAAERFAAAGAEYLHLVDLDGAKEGFPKNQQLISTVAKTCGMPCEIGGGIRTIKDIAFYVENGISRVILGSAALSDAKLVKESVKEFGEKIAVGIDARDRKVCVSGWLEESEVDYIDFSKQMEDIGIRNIIFTDISRDGMLNGPNLEQLTELKANVSCDITASGGVRDLNHIEQLKSLGIYGAICGKSLYSGTLELAEAISLCREDSKTC